MELTDQRNLVHQTRDARRSKSFPKLSPAERDSLIKKHHPDHRAHAYRPIIFGPNAGQSTVTEVATLLEGESPVPADLDLTPALLRGCPGRWWRRGGVRVGASCPCPGS